MKNAKIIIATLLVLALSACVRKAGTDREIWVGFLDKIARPVLENLANETLRFNMPVESSARNPSKLAEVTHLEALGRVVVGIAPWMELGPDETAEGRLRTEYIGLACKAIANAVDPASPDYLNFKIGTQPLVDAAFLAQGLLRAPTQLWGNLDSLTKERLVEELKSTRAIKPWLNNWLLFSAMVEVTLLEFTGEWNREPVDYAIEKHIEWYKGDGLYGDGPAFHFDYYNSFVIQPMLMTILEVLKKHGIAYEQEGKDMFDLQRKRYSRYAAIQERLISPEGTYPVVGRSLCYRFGAFHALEDASLRHMLPRDIDPAQVRNALTTVISRQMTAPGTFDDEGWLTLGFCGHQPGFGERYISTGSLYLVCAGFVALGLPEDDPFWCNPAAPWTSKKGWNGVDLEADHALKH